MTDAEYIIGFKQNNQDVISDFYRTYRDGFFAFIMSLDKKPVDFVAELYSDSVVNLWKNVQRGKLTVEGLSSSLSTYLNSIGKYSLWSANRKKKDDTVGDETYFNNLSDMPADIESLMEQDALIDFVYKTAREMKPPCSDLLTAYYWDKLSMKEIAAKYNYNGENSAKTQKWKCIKKMRVIVDKFRASLVTSF